MNETKKVAKKQSDTKAEILKAARCLFTKQGFAATSMGSIAKAANVNHSLIFHHFGNKQGLWEAVRQAIVTKAQSQQDIMPSLDLSLSEFLYQLLSHRIAAYRADPELLQIVNWQRIEKESNDIGIRENTCTDAWLKAFSHYQTQGEIDKKHKPEFILTLVFAIASSAAFDPNIYIKSPKQLSNYLHFCVKTLCQGLSIKVGC